MLEEGIRSMSWSRVFIFLLEFFWLLRDLSVKFKDIYRSELLPLSEESMAQILKQILSFSSTHLIDYIRGLDNK